MLATLLSFLGVAVLLSLLPGPATALVVRSAALHSRRHATFNVLGNSTGILGWALATVLGISPDPVTPIANFDSKYGLGFPLLSDEDHAVAESYGVWVEKSMYGRKYMGNERTTFVIGPDGTIREVFRRVKPAEHDDLVLGAL